MPPSDLQTALLELLLKQNVSPWLVAVLVIICSAIGSFISSYLHKKGESQALNDNFAAIRKQLMTTTRDTEEIKIYLSGHAWRSQQQWAACNEYYRSLLDHLYRFKSALESLFDYYLEAGSEHILDRSRDARFRKLVTEASVAYSETQQLVGPAAIFLSPAATTILEHLFKAHWELTTFSVTCNYEYIEGASKMAEDAYRQVLLEAKQQLGMTDNA